LKSASLQYATALADIALAQGASEALEKQLDAFGELYAESADLRNFMESPAVGSEAKHGVIDKLAARLGAGKIACNFLYVLTDHHRTALLANVLDAFREILRQRQGIAQAEISTAVEMSAAQKKNLGKTLEKLTGKKVEAQYSLDPALLGGAVVRIGSTIYDGSLRNQLNSLRTRLAAE
jgi:F-type H+-transporting ATPase subunit delta